MKSTITTRPLIELVEEYLLTDASERARVAKSVWESIHMPGAAEGVSSESAYSDKVSAEAELNQVTQFTKMALKMTESRRLHRDAGLAEVAVFDTEESLRIAVEASCGFEVVVTICRKRSMSCRMQRTKSPGVSSGSRIRDSGFPAAHPAVSCASPPFGARCICMPR